MTFRHHFLMSRFLILAACALFSGCLAENQTTPSNVATTKASWFDGVQGVQNLGGYGVPPSMKVSWNASSQTVLSYRIYMIPPVGSGGTSSWELVDEVGASMTSYVHTGLLSGALYTYRVRAVDVTGVEDTNDVSKASVAFDGIADVIVDGPGTAIARINSAMGSFDEVRIYGEPKGGTRTLLGKMRGSETALTITGLRTGVSYKFSAQAYMGFAGAEDGNQVYIQTMVPSESFGSGDPSEGTSAYSYRGFMNVMAYGPAPGAPTDTLVASRSPNARLVRLTWLPFAGATGSTKYRVFRIKSGGTMDLSTLTACTTSTPATSTCVVCERTGGGSQTCEDQAIPSFNSTTTTAQYLYAVSLVKTDSVTGDQWAENLPSQNTSDFQLTVHMPPDNMVLVQRDAVNYERCQILGRASDPRKKQRCVYKGLGAVPLKSGPERQDLNLTTGYFDFGYNLFIDRWPLACNWTTQASGGMCGNDSTPGHPTPGDCIGFVPNSIASPSTNPLPNVFDANFVNKGKIGDVFFLDGSIYSCYIKTASGWKAPWDAMTIAERTGFMTNDPSAQGGHRPLAVRSSQAEAFTECQSHTTGYGKKRLLRRREHIAGMQMPWMSGEPFAIPEWGDRLRVASGNDGVLGNYRECGPTSTDLANAQFNPTAVANVTTGGSAAYLSITNSRGFLTSGGMTYGFGDFLVGNPYTTGCVSRFGVVLSSASQLTGGVIRSLYPLSDQVVRQANSGSYASHLGVTSSLDSGNTDTNGFKWDGTTQGMNWISTIGGLAGVSVDQGEVTSASRSLFPYFNPILGLAVAFKSSSTEDIMSLRDFLATRIYQTNIYVVDTNSPAIGSIGASQADSRLPYAVQYQSLSTDANSGWHFRCAQEAE